VMDKGVLVPPPMWCSTLWSAMDLGGGLFKQGWCGDDIRRVNLYPRALSLQ
jgi:hypothetical protein